MTPIRHRGRPTPRIMHARRRRTRTRVLVKQDLPAKDGDLSGLIFYGQG